MFVNLDQDQKDFLSLNDFRSFLQSNNVEYSDDNLRKFIHIYDRDRDFAINIEELFNIILPRKNEQLKNLALDRKLEEDNETVVTILHPEVVAIIVELICRELALIEDLANLADEIKNSRDFTTYEAYVLIDSDNAKFIAERSLRAFMRRNGFNLTEEELREVIFYLDNDGDGQVSYQEFQEIFSPFRVGGGHLSSGNSGNGSGSRNGSGVKNNFNFNDRQEEMEQTRDNPVRNNRDGREGRENPKNKNRNQNEEVIQNDNNQNINRNLLSSYDDNNLAQYENYANHVQHHDQDHDLENNHQEENEGIDKQAVKISKNPKNEKFSENVKNVKNVKNTKREKNLDQKLDEKNSNTKIENNTQNNNSNKNQNSNLNFNKNNEKNNQNNNQVKQNQEEENLNNQNKNNNSNEIEVANQTQKQNENENEFNKNTLKFSYNQNVNEFFGSSQNTFKSQDVLRSQDGLFKSQEKFFSTMSSINKTALAMSPLRTTVNEDFNLRASMNTYTSPVRYRELREKEEREGRQVRENLDFNRSPQRELRSPEVMRRTQSPLSNLSPNRSSNLLSKTEKTIRSPSRINQIRSTSPTSYYNPYSNFSTYLPSVYYSKSESDKLKSRTLAKFFNDLVNLDTNVEILRESLALKSDFNLKEIFNYFDFSGRNSISLIDFREVLKDFDIYASAEELKLVFKRFDVNLDGRLE